MSSRLLSEKSVEEVLNPAPLTFEYQGQTHQVLPMPDSSLMLIADSLSVVASVIDGVGKALDGGLTAADIIPVLPEIVKALLPNASKLIAASLGVESNVVAAMPVTKKLEALRLIVLQEDLPLILKNWTALVATFRLPETASTEG